MFAPRLEGEPGELFVQVLGRLRALRITEAHQAEPHVCLKMSRSKESELVWTYGSVGQSCGLKSQRPVNSAEKSRACVARIGKGSKTFHYSEFRKAWTCCFSTGVSASYCSRTLLASPPWRIIA